MEQSLESLSTLSSSFSSSSSSSSSSQDSSAPAWSFNLQKNTLAKELEQLPIPFMVNVLDEMTHEPGLESLQREVLSNPFNVSKILKSEPLARTKLTVYFQWLEKSTTNFVWELVENICHFICRSFTDLSDGHLLGFRSTIQLGTFLMEAGWYAESIILLNIAKGQAKSRSLKKLQVLKTLLIATSLSSRNEAASSILAEINGLMSVIRTIPLCQMTEIHCALSVSYFEQCQFGASYQQGLLALQMLNENNCPYETIVETFRQLSKSCIAKKRFSQAKLLISQAVSWAWHKFGPTNVVYAETLEDYAFYLLMVNAYDDAVKVESEARNIYFDLYGHLGLQADLAQGNLAFRMYLESCRYHELGRIDQYMEYISDLDKNRRLETGASDDRQMVAIRRIQAIEAVANLSRQDRADGDQGPRDTVENVQPQLTVKLVRKLFFAHFH